MRDIAPFGLRIPAELKIQIGKAAEENQRSLNGEMVVRLEASFHAPLAEYSDGELISELMRRYGRGDIYIRIGKPSGEDFGR